MAKLDILTPRFPARRPLGPARLILLSQWIQVWLKDDPPSSRSCGTTARPAFVNLRRGRQEASKTAPIFRDPDVIAAEIVEDLEAALAQLKLARCPHSLTASLAALPSMSLIPFTPFAEIANDLKTN